MNRQPVTNDKVLIPIYKPTDLKTLTIDPETSHYPFPNNWTTFLQCHVLEATVETVTMDRMFFPQRDHLAHQPTHNYLISFRDLVCVKYLRGLYLQDKLLLRQ